MLPLESLQILKEGNDHFALGRSRHPRQSITRRRVVLAGQNPFAIVLTCSDSRVPPEILFDQGIGDLFVIRTAGNVIDEVVIGSIEYAVEHLRTPLVVVMGHQRCGAVSAAVQGGHASGCIARVVEKIAPAVQTASRQPGDLLSNAIDANVASIVNQLKNSQPILAGHYEEKKIDIIGARYDLEDGKVVFFA